MNDSSPINMPLAEAEQATRTLMDYAYEQGFHEMGYDPLAALIEAARAEGATAERARLAGSASEQDRVMVNGLINRVALNRDEGSEGSAERVEILGEAILATLTARRAEALGEAARIADQRGVSAGETYGVAEQAGCDMAAAAIRASIPRGPGRGEG